MSVWDRLTGSPVLQASVSNKLPPSIGRESSVFDMELCDLSLNDATESVVETHRLPPHFAYAYFERDHDKSQLELPNGQSVTNLSPVVPRPVLADIVSWTPLLSSAGDTGHRFSLVHQGDVQANVEVFLNEHGGVDRMLIVHSLYSALSHSAKLIDRSSILEFNPMEKHIAKVAEMATSTHTSEFYLPVNEIVVGSHLSNVSVLVPQRLATHAEAKNAQAAFNQARSDMIRMSTAVFECIENHNSIEFRRVGVDTVLCATKTLSANPAS